MFSEKQTQDQKIQNLIEKIKKNDDTLLMNDIYIPMLEILVDSQKLLKKISEEIKPKTKNIVIDPLKAGSKDIVIGKIELRKEI